MSKKQSENVIIIDPEHAKKEYIKDLYRYRELFYFFVWRDVLIRYKQTSLGIAWAVIRPLLYMGVFVLVFGKIAHLDKQEINYPLFILSGMLPWQLFSTCLHDSSSCLIANAPLISKVYFPRIILPINHIVVTLVDFLISLAMLFALLIVTGSLSPWTFFLMPLFLGLNLVLCLGSSLWLSAITVRYRDFRFIIPFIMQFGMFMSPVGYSSAQVPEAWRWVYFLNPMAGIIEGFRWSYFGVYHSFLPFALATSLIISVTILITGFAFFRKMERIFADII
jgi:lipopolysaccharide transport system permease protein